MMQEPRPTPPLQPENPTDAGRLTYEQLFDPFLRSPKPKSAFRIGIEAERFGLNRSTFAPLQYDGPRGILGIFRHFVRQHGWIADCERPGGPVVSIHRGDAGITLEPAGQIEFSGSPLPDVHAVEKERRCCATSLESLNEELNLTWIASGFHPLARHDELPWVPKLRYGIMRVYLATQGSDALEMMRRTATIQANFDYASIEDGLRKLRLGLRLSPLVSAIFANGPLVEGRLYGGKSRRIQTWLSVDPARQGLLPQMWSPTSTLRDYVQWALDAPMFMFLRRGEAVANTGQTFRSFFRDGFQGHSATMKDWKAHLNTLFPEVRLKQTLEVRGADSVPRRYAAALPALWTGILYDERALDEAEHMTRDWTYAATMDLRQNLARDGLSAVFEGKPLAHWANELFAIATDGLNRRARPDEDGRTEAVYLEDLGRVIAQGRCPADEVIEALGDEPTPREIVRATLA